ncbi:MAG: AAA family ATPase, partial [Muribaculaceae bacterium]|nr:AAA family ATPase [Muribaculaceae bacterium]
MTELRYPVGEQDFAKIRTQNLVYVDKTEVLYRLVTTRSYYFLNRPRRFGKSLMLSTLRYYFEGRRELFQGLAMERLEQQWTVHPVIYLDMSSEKYAEVANLHSAINDMLTKYEQLYGVELLGGNTYGTRLDRIIEAAHEATGQGVVVLIDEYDAPMLDATGDEAKMEVMRNITRSLYSPLKAKAAQLRFVMLTGITKFSQLSIFSELNNLSNISMEPDYEAICGITEHEMLTQLRLGIEQMAQRTGVTMDECV